MVMAPAMSRHLLRVDGRHVHYRRAGSGPPILVLPATNSARPVLRYVEAFSRDYTVLLFDTPGYGLSDPLAMAAPSAADYADALAETLDVLGLRRCGVLGSHGGATFALALAQRNPARVAALAIDEHPAYTPAEVADMLAHYLPPFVPVWNGVHLADFWLRYREQAVFRPWNRPAKDHRIAGDARDLDYIQDVCNIQFGAGSSYPLAYKASLNSDGVGAAEGLKMPAIIAHRRDDVFMQALRHAKALPKSVAVDLFPLDEAVPRYTAFFAERMQGVPAFAPPSAKPANEPTIRRDMMRIGGSDVLVRSAGRTAAQAVLLVPRLPGGASGLEALMVDLGRDRFVVAVDLPGNGDSTADGATLTVPAYAGLLAALADVLGLRVLDVFAHNGGGVVAAALAAARPGLVRQLVLDSPPLLDSALRAAFQTAHAEAIVPRPDGAHLLAVWRAIRNEQLFWPWFDESPAAVRRIEADLDPVRLNARVVDVLRQHRSHAAVGQAVFGFPLAETLAALTAPVTIGWSENDVFAETVAEAGSFGLSVVEHAPGPDGQIAFARAALKVG